MSAAGDFPLDDRLSALPRTARSAEPTPEAARRAIGLLDFTSLADDDDAERIEAFCARAVTPAGPVAGVCLYPRFVPLARRLVAGAGIRVVTVANFPAGAADADRAAAETLRAADNGADEIDVVYPQAAHLDGDEAAGPRLVAACRRAAGGLTLKVILETGGVTDAGVVRATARAALAEGADFLKTSTGKRGPGATLSAAALLLDEIQASGRPVGLKPSGGIRSAADAAAYMALTAAMMGEGWLVPARFRLGASGVLPDLVATAMGESPAAAAPPGY